MEASLLQALVSQGPLGLLILYLVMERKNDRQQSQEDGKARIAEDQLRRAADEKRADADLKMASAITTLALKIGSPPHVGP